LIETQNPKSIKKRRLSFFELCTDNRVLT